MLNEKMTKSRLTGFTKKNGIIILVLLAMLLCTVLSETFLTKSNIFNVLKQISVIVILEGVFKLKQSKREWQQAG